MSQETLGEEIGVSFQQIQKYESGYTRVSCSRLWMISQAQQTPIGYYFGFRSPHDSDQLDSEAIRFLLVFERLPEPQRKAVRLLMFTMAHSTESDPP